MAERNTGHAVEAPAPTTPEDAIARLLNEEEDEKDALRKEGEGEEAPEEPVDETADSEDNSDESEPRYKIKVGGEELEVPLSELLRGYQRQADYTRKTQKIAEERKRLIEEYEAAAKERQQYAIALQVLEQQLVGDEPDWEKLRQEDPARFAQEWAAFQKRQKVLETIRAEQQALNHLEQIQREELLRRKIEEERDLLVAAIPEWVDSERAAREKAALIEYGKSIGFSEEELNNIYDHRAVVLLRKAWLYDQARKSAAKPQAPSTKTAPPGSRTGKLAAQKARERLAKTGSIEDAAAVIAAML